MAISNVEKSVLKEEETKPELAYQYLKAFKSDVVRLHGENVYLYGSVELNYEFARDIKGADIEKHQERVVKSKDPQINYLFAKNVKGCNILPHSKVILESRDLKYNYLFLRDVVSELNTPVAQGHILLISNSKEIEYHEALNRLIESRKSIERNHVRK